MLLKENERLIQEIERSRKSAAGGMLLILIVNIAILITLWVK